VNARGSHLLLYTLAVNGTLTHSLSTETIYTCDPFNHGRHRKTTLHCSDAISKYNVKSTVAFLLTLINLTPNQPFFSLMPVILMSKWLFFTYAYKFNFKSTIIYLCL